jgi:uncharacterized protein YjlB
VETYRFADDGAVPNSALPLIRRCGAVTSTPDDPASSFEATFAGNGWTGSWRNGIFDYDHYHSTAHEVLGLAAGTARVRFGGPSGQVIDLAAGDVVVIPAGVGHALVEGSADLLVVGAYAEGRTWDLVRADPALAARARQRIAAVPLPTADPVDGPNGPLTTLWAADARL